jgi:DNA-binding NarL/FixJ family response regulator
VTTTATPAPAREIRVLVVDDHPAVRAGLEGLFVGEPAIDCVATLAGASDLMQAVRAKRPDVVVLDYALGEGDGLSACFRLKQQSSPPGVVLYSAYVDHAFAVPSAIAQADAIVAKGGPLSELLSAISGVASGAAERGPLDPELVEAASARLVSDDVPIAAMLLAATPVPDIADILDLSVREVHRRAQRIIGRMQAGDRLKAAAPRTSTGLPE